MRRAPLLGLGATVAPKSHKEKRFYRPGESREPKKDLVVYDSKGGILVLRHLTPRLPIRYLTPTYSFTLLLTRPIKGTFASKLIGET